MPRQSSSDEIVQLVEASLFVSDYVLTAENLVTQGVGKVR
jgi:hypothetical protein